MRKVGIGLLVVVALVAGAWHFARAAIGEALFERVVSRQVGVDRTAALPDGLHAFVCGSGSPMPDAMRAGPCIAVLAGNTGLVFDAGSGSARKLLRMGFPAEKLQGVFLTHLHSDHFDGLGELLLQAWIGGSRGAPLPVYGPAGTDKVVGGLMAAYAIDRDFRIAHHGPQVARPAGYGGAAQMIALGEGEPAKVVYDAGGVKVTAIRVNHAPVAPAFGYRIDYKGRSIAISGDTVYTSGFAGAAHGADVVFHEAMNKRMVAALQAALAAHGRADSAKIMGDIQGYHSSPEDAARVASEAGAKVLVLYHLVPAPPSRLIEAAFVGDAGKGFGGPIKVARDGMRVSLPAGSSRVDFANDL